MTKKIDMKDYQKPELIHIDDSAFDETGQGNSWVGPGKDHNGNNGNHGNHGNGNNGNHYGNLPFNNGGRKH